VRREQAGTAYIMALSRPLLPPGDTHAAAPDAAAVAELQSQLAATIALAPGVSTCTANDESRPC